MLQKKRTDNLTSPWQCISLHAANDDGEKLKAEQLDIADPPPHTDGAVEEADPDPLHHSFHHQTSHEAGTAQTIHIYMDELAPLTTKDYRPPPLQESFCYTHRNWPHVNCFI